MCATQRSFWKIGVFKSRLFNSKNRTFKKRTDQYFCEYFLKLLTTNNVFGILRESLDSQITFFLLFLTAI